MDARDTSGAAFPRPASTDEHSDPCNVYQDQIGLTKREWFAGMALVGMETWCPTGVSGFAKANVHEAKAEWAVRMADALLAALAEDAK